MPSILINSLDIPIFFLFPKQCHNNERVLHIDSHFVRCSLKLIHRFYLYAMKVFFKSENFYALCKLVTLFMKHLGIPSTMKHQTNNPMDDWITKYTITNLHLDQYCHKILSNKWLTSLWPYTVLFLSCYNSVNLFRIDSASYGCRYVFITGVLWTFGLT